MLFPDVSEAPPTLIVTAEYDSARDEGEAYGAKLAAAGVPVTRIRVGETIHGFPGIFFATRLEETKRT